MKVLRPERTRSLPGADVSETWPGETRDMLTQHVTRSIFRQTSRIDLGLDIDLEVWATAFRGMVRGQIC